MTDRLLCKSPECSNTILPMTAERTNGFCMPCVRAAETAERDEYIRKNRRDLNEFDGVTDPVEILTIIHKPWRFDPLINWIPHPTPVDQLYCELNIQDQLRLAEYAESLIGTNRNREAEDIVLCLAAFTDAPLENCLRAMVSKGIFRPSLPFHCSSAELRDDLISRLEHDNENRNSILLALSWIGDLRVIELFESWRKQPPSWTNKLYIPPQDYAREAGWELTDDGQRRDLFFHGCLKLVNEHSSSPREFKVITEREDTCPWCSSKLTTLFKVTPSILGLSKHQSEINDIQVITCEICTLFGLIFGQVDSDGNSSLALYNLRPEYLPDASTTWDRLPQDSLTLAGKRSEKFAADSGLPTTFSQIGGLPTWEQDAEYPTCPGCSKTMMFLAQIDHADIDDYTEGIYYAFFCPTCRVTATGYQQT